MLQTILLVFVAFGLAMAMMAVGVIFSGRCLRGSCGGTPVFGPDGEPITCATCPNKDKHQSGEHERDDRDSGDCARRNAPIH